jgi:hypothetical protein
MNKGPVSAAACNGEGVTPLKECHLAGGCVRKGRGGGVYYVKCVCV